MEEEDIEKLEAQARSYFCLTDDDVI